MDLTIGQVQLLATTGGALAPNVVTTGKPKVTVAVDTSTVVMTPGNHPDGIALDVAAGGYDFVVEVGADAIRRYLVATLRPARLSVKLDPAAAKSLGNPGTGLATAQLRLFEVRFPADDEIELLYSPAAVAVGNARSLDRITPAPTVGMRFRLRLDVDPADGTAGVHAVRSSLTFNDASAGTAGGAIWEPLTRELIERVQTLLPAKDFLVLPRVSITGPRESAEPVVEIERFDVAFTTLRGSPDQKVAVLVSAIPGSAGHPADVADFIGGNDYGLIVSDEVIDRVFRYRWRTGGFARAMDLPLQVRVEDNGKLKVVNIQAVFYLLTLERVEIVTNANTRTDYIHLTGKSEIRVVSAQFLDGTSIDPATLSLPPTPDWGIYTTPDFLDVPEPNLVRKALRDGVWEDGYRPMANPFVGDAGFTALEPAYIRLDAVRRQALVLGKALTALKGNS